MDKTESIIANRSFAFVLAVIKMTKSLNKSYENIVIIKQILRSVTSIGANIEEGLGAGSKRGFAHCMNIAKKEARETQYWLKLLFEINKDSKSELLVLLQENLEIVNMLTKIVKTASVNL